MYGTCIPPEIILLFKPAWDVFFSLQNQTQMLIVAFVVCGWTYNWAKMILREAFMHRYILHDRKFMMRMSTVDWVVFALTYPVTTVIARYVFSTLATWRMLLHAVWHTTLQYVTAPKALNVAAPDDRKTTGDSRYHLCE